MHVTVRGDSREMDDAKAYELCKEAKLCPVPWRKFIDIALLPFPTEVFFEYALRTNPSRLDLFTFTVDNVTYAHPDRLFPVVRRLAINRAKEQHKP